KTALSNSPVAEDREGCHSACSDARFERICKRIQVNLPANEFIGFYGKIRFWKHGTSNSQNSQSSTLSFVSFVSFVRFRICDCGWEHNGRGKRSPVVQRWMGCKGG